MADEPTKPAGDQQRTNDAPAKDSETVVSDKSATDTPPAPTSADPAIVNEDRPDEPVKEPESKQSHPFYCPGCGRRWNYPTECRGQSDTAPHPPIEVVSTDELDSDDPEDHTAAPASE